MRRSKRFIWLVCLILLSGILLAQEKDPFLMTIEELMSIKITTVSKIDERLTDAPANIVVITKEDLITRGYTELTQIFDDLLGMDISRFFGSDGYVNYMRGFRAYIGSNYEILIDGISFDHLWLENDQILATFPLSNIKKVEIVYGPSSSIYGVGALQGVINIITTKSKIEPGLNTYGKISTGFNSYNLADLNVVYTDTHKKLKISLTGRFEDFDVKDLVDNNRYEWTKDKYLTNEKLWGGLLENKAYTGKFSSVTQNKALDARLFFSGAEAGFQYFRLDPGSGILAAADRLQPRSRFGYRETTIYLKNKIELLSDRLKSKSLIRFRNSDTPTDSPFIYAQNYQVDGETKRQVSITLYQSLSSSWTFSQDFEYTPLDYLSFVTGFKYERKNLQRDYETTSGSLVNIEDFDHNTYDYPDPLPEIYQYNNRIFQTEKGFYLQGNWKYLQDHRIVIGFRFDNNSQFGDVFTFRGALISNFDKLTVKLLYGEGSQPPPPRTLYGTWEHQGKNINLEPVKSRTYELNLNYLTSFYSANISGYFINTDNSILQMTGGAENVGVKKVMGIDFHFKTILENILKLKRMELWFAYGFISAKGDETPIFNLLGQIIDFKYEELGDIADHRFLFGSTAYISDKLSITFLGRFIGERKTFYSNPYEKIDSYFVLDANILYRNILDSGLGISLKVTNITDAYYFHPGVGSANAGDDTPGKWEDGIWKGSGGYYSSKLTQPKRFVLLSFLLDI